MTPAPPDYDQLLAMWKQLTTEERLRLRGIGTKTGRYPVDVMMDEIDIPHDEKGAGSGCHRAAPAPTDN